MRPIPTGGEIGVPGPIVNVMRRTLIQPNPPHLEPLVIIIPMVPTQVTTLELVPIRLHGIIHMLISPMTHQLITLEAMRIILACTYMITLAPCLNRPHPTFVSHPIPALASPCHPLNTRWTTSSRLKRPSCPLALGQRLEFWPPSIPSVTSSVMTFVIDPFLNASKSPWPPLVAFHFKISPSGATASIEIDVCTPPRFNTGFQSVDGQTLRPTGDFTEGEATRVRRHVLLASNPNASAQALIHLATARPASSVRPVSNESDEVESGPETEQPQTPPSPLSLSPSASISSIIGQSLRLANEERSDKDTKEEADRLRRTEVWKV